MLPQTLSVSDTHDTVSADGLMGPFTPVLALYDTFGVDVLLNFDITHSLNFNKAIKVMCS